VVGDHRPAVVELYRSVDEEPFAIVKPKVRIDRLGRTPCSTKSLYQPRRATACSATW
jgi:hypothetical protein